jgi:sugar lactone lactonase YvrE
LDIESYFIGIVLARAKQKLVLAKKMFQGEEPAWVELESFFSWVTVPGGE